ncbi:MAG: 4,5:9,10-diseco-3-hydroxy-5,9,17-trioxoandrosta(10),2-diene-4-oate hydrolase [Nocardioides sp.]|nr:4,5:9,10-diseco-3-hydroxy-5,9,17-trioxoandrosta(10),2-diene-4-oate hydrolase [Nocardioides sp.]
MSPEDTRRTHVVDGHELAYHDVGEGPVVVLLHGSGPGVNGWANFGHTLPALSQGLRCLVVDLPGFGASGRPEKYERNYLRIAADAVVGLLDALGLETASLVGNSMGADVCVRIALDHPKRITKLLLNGAGGTGVPVFGPSPSEGIARLMEFNADPTRERMAAWVLTMMSDQRRATDELVDARLAAALAPGAVKNMQDVYGTFYDPAMAEAVPLWAEVHRIKQPTLMLWGRDDRVTPVEGAFLPARRMPRCDLRIYSRCGHWVPVERQADFERAALEHLA